MKIKPKKWEEFQHYKDIHYEKGARPAWLKLHRKLLDDVTFQRLPRSSQALAPMLWLIASEHPEGLIEANPEDLAFRLRWPESEMSEALSPLIGKGFFEIVQFPTTESRDSLDTGYSGSRTEEKRVEEKRKETPIGPLTRTGARLAGKSEKRQQAIAILEFLNGRAGKHFRPVPANLKFIEARLADGVSVQDLKTLIVRKCREWLGSDMDKFLRPETLFNATKCQSYLGEIEPEEPAGDQPCNAHPAIEASSPAPSPAGADGPPPTSLESSAALH